MLSKMLGFNFDKEKLMVFEPGTIIWMLGVFGVGVVYALFALYWSVTGKKKEEQR